MKRIPVTEEGENACDRRASLRYKKEQAKSQLDSRISPFYPCHTADYSILFKGNSFSRFDWEWTPGWEVVEPPMLLLTYIYHIVKPSSSILDSTRRKWETQDTRATSSSSFACPFFVLDNVLFLRLTEASRGLLPASSEVNGEQVLATRQPRQSKLAEYTPTAVQVVVLPSIRGTFFLCFFDLLHYHY